MKLPYRSLILRWVSLLVLAALLLSSCVVAPTPYAAPTLPPTATAIVTVTPTAAAAATATPPASPTATAAATATAVTAATQPPAATRTPLPLMLPTRAPAKGALTSLGLGRVQGLAISAAGDMAVASPFGVQVYRDTSFRPLWSLPVENGVTALAYSPDGKRLAGAAPGALILWDAASGAELARAEAAASSSGPFSLAGLTFAPDASRLFGQDMAGYVISWDLSSTAPEILVPGDPNRAGSAPGLAFATHVACSPDGKQILFSQWSRLTAWDLDKNAAAWTVDFTQSASESVSAYGYTPDGRSIYVAGIQGISFYDPQTGASTLTLVSQPNETDALYAPDGKTLISLANGRPLIWNAEGSVTARLPYTGVQKLLLYNDQTLALLLWDGEIRLVSLPDGKQIAELRGYTNVLGLQYLQNGRVLAADALGLFQLWDVAQSANGAGQTLQTIAALAISPDAVLAVEVGRTLGGRILTSEINAEGQPVFALRDTARPETLFTWPAASSLGASAAAFTADGKTLAVIADRIYLIDAQAGKLRISLDLPKNISYSPPRFTPDGKTMILATYGTDYLLYSTATGKLIKTVSLPGEITELAISPDGKLLAVGGDSNSNGEASSVTLVETATGKTRFALSLPDTVQSSPLFAPDGLTLATIDHVHGVIWLWETKTGQPLGGIKAAAASLAFSPDGKRLAAADDAGRIHFFDLSAPLEVKP